MKTEPKHNDVRVVGDQLTGLMWTVQRYCVSNYTQGGKPLVKKGWYELKKENGDTHVFLDPRRSRRSRQERTSRPRRRIAAPPPPTARSVSKPQRA